MRLAFEHLIIDRQTSSNHKTDKHLRRTHTHSSLYYIEAAKAVYSIIIVKFNEY
jgi:hypothetical protein